MIVYREISTLSHDLDIPVKTLYAISNSVRRHYHPVNLPKGDGTFRQLTVPDKILKKIQRRITECLLVHLPISRYATAYRYGGSIFHNAAPHVGQERILKLDIQHFFDNILYSTVKEAAFPSKFFAEPLRVLLTILCYGKETLPQGAPSSPAITNLLMRDFDEEVGAWCGAQNVAYTRYCDDLTFSGQFDAGALHAFVGGALRGMGFFLNERKTALVRAGRQQNVTGLVVNEKIGVPREIRRVLRQELHYCQRFGLAGHLEIQGSDAGPDRYRAQLLGRVNYALQATPDSAELLGYRVWLIDQGKK